MLAKVVNGKLVVPTEAERQKIVITNPSEDSLKFNLGYKELRVEERPTYDRTTQVIKAVFEDTEGFITQRWEVVELTEESEEEAVEF